MNRLLTHGLLILTLCVADGCAKEIAPVSTEAFARSAVILIPGYYGTRLARVADGRLMWLSVGQAFGNGSPLTLPLSDLELDGTPLRSDGILTEIPIVPWLYKIDAYGSILTTLRSSGLKVMAFDYDWRGDLIEAVRALHNTVESLKSSGVDRIALVAHSMGGLIACYYLRYGTQDTLTAIETWEGAAQVTTVVLVGVPFGGSMTTFRNMTYGRPIGFNKTLLNFEAVSSFPASYYLLPHDDSDLLLTHDGTTRQGLIGDSRNWSQYQWGLLRDKDDSRSEAAQKRFSYISRWLEQAHRFHDLVRAPLAARRSTVHSLMSVTGTGESTLARGRFDDQATGLASIRFDDGALPSHAGSKKIDLFEDGDGTVTGRASALPDAYATQFALTRRPYEAEHIELMNREDTQRDILGFIVKELKASVYTSKPMR